MSTDQPTDDTFTLLASDPYDDRSGPWFSQADLKKLAALPAGTKLRSGAAMTSAPDIDALVERLNVTADQQHGSLENDVWCVDELRDAASALTSLQADLKAARAEIERCHARLEIDHHFVLSEGDELVRVEIPIDQRGDEPDGIECRDATIALLDSEIEKLRTSRESAEASLAEALTALKPFADAVRHTEKDDTAARDLACSSARFEITVGDLRRAKSARRALTTHRGSE